MKRTLLYILSVLMLIQACWGLVIISAFYVNRDYIAQYLCENRGNPQLHCEGNCVLMKKMKKARDNEKKNIENKIKEANFFVLASTTDLISPWMQEDLDQQPNFDQRNALYTFHVFNRMLRPPNPQHLPLSVFTAHSSAILA